MLALPFTIAKWYFYPQVNNMGRKDNNLQEVLNAIAERDRRPVLCAECRDTADGLAIAAELLDSPDVPHPWVCDDCRQERDER